jgi:NADH:ubiquinone oxidoreductase subunit 4 (subunit M)
MIVLLAWLGLYPQPVLDVVQPALHGMQAVATAASPYAVALR